MKKTRVKIIAEIGVNHDGNYKKAVKLVRLAKLIGVDAVKFQTFKTADLCKIDAPKTNHQSRNILKKLTQFQMLKKLELNESEFLKLFKLCKKLKIEFLSTPYDIRSVDLLERIGVKTYKVASPDLVDLNLHRRIIKTKKKVIISTGACTLREIKKTVSFYKRKGHKNFTLMHCVSNYPYDENNSNLNLIKKLKKEFKCPVGFSDHGKSNEPAKIAVSLGAEIIEKHFTYNKKANGPDHSSSFDVKDFRNYVDEIRRTEKLLGKPLKKVYLEEKSFRKYARKSITLNKDLEKDSKIKYSDFEMKRPGTGLNGQFIEMIMGKKIKKKLKKNYQLKLRDLKL